MKTKYKLLVFLLCLTNYSYSQWEMVNPLPTASTITSLYFINNNTGFFGTRTSLFKTTNAGVNWFQKSTFRFDKIEFLNNNTGYAVEYDKILKTTNAGETWTIIFTSGGLTYSLSFLDANTGYVAAWDVGRELYKTTNGGSNWEHISSHLNNNYINFLNENTGYSSGQGIKKTTDGGFTWNIMINQNFDYNLKSIKFVNDQTGWVSGDYMIFKTTNSGISWDSITLPTTYGLFEMWFLNENYGIITGSTGKVLVTSNGGVNWLLNEPGGDLRASFLLNQNTAFIAGLYGKLCRTTDFGSTWQSLQSGPNVDQRGVYALSSNTCYTAGDGGLILKSTNTGITWQSYSVGSGIRLRSICFTDINTGYTCGELGVIYKTTNAGQNWNSLVSGTPNHLNVIRFPDVSTGYALLSNGLVKTTNGGANWNSMSTIGSAHSSMYFVNKDTGFIVNGNSVLKTTNGASNWSSTALSCGGGCSLNFLDVCFTSPLVGYIAGYKLIFVTRTGVIYKTTDGGTTWNESYNFGTRQIEKLNFADNTVYALGSDYCYKSTTAGSTWDSSFVNLGLYNLSFFNSEIGYIVGPGGQIFRTTNGGLVGFTGINQQSPDNFFLSQNYPNPFNPTTKIKFDVPASVKSQTSNVKLVIFDIIGREITTLLNSELKPGTYEADWDASNFSSGIYFYKIISGDFVETKKMVLMK